MKFWYAKSYSLLAILLFPLSLVFRGIVAFRYFLYRLGVKKVFHFKVPVIVVGNLTVGGAGKTPLVIWIANFLKTAGFQPGIVSRGCGGKRHSAPYFVQENATAKEVGDEAILLLQRTQCPLVLCVDRVQAVKTLLEKTTCDVVIADDGLQHYALGRQIEIAVIDGDRQLGNELLLPAGPLREPIARLQRVNFVVENSLTKITPSCDKSAVAIPRIKMHLYGENCIALRNKNQQIPIKNFAGTKVHAVAGIGNPTRFFKSLEHKGLTIIPHTFPDHYLYQASDFDFKDSYPILMTEKDAVKCRDFADDKFWYVPVSAILDASFGEEILTALSLPQ
jgi:tetraacyldisaccharide 4'-kinase